MILKVYNIDVPITPGVMPPVIHIGQYVSACQYICHLKNDDGNDYIIPSNTTATFTGCNPRKEVFDLEATVDTGANTISIIPKDEATSMWGKYGATLNLFNGDDRLTPIVILMDVQKAGATDEEIAGAANFPDAVTEAVNDWLEDNIEEGQLGTLFVPQAPQAAKTSEMTQPVGMDENGKLWTTPGGGSGAVTPASIVTATSQMTTAQKTNTRSNINAAPSTNIAKSALASAVQTSLGKADSAYQKPSGGIPASDMASAVQTALTAAGTAVQPSALAGYVPVEVFAAVTPSADLVEVKRDTQTGKLYVLVNGSTPAPSGDSNTVLITVSGGGIADKTSSEIYTILSGGAVNLVLIDSAGRQGTLVKKPVSSGYSYTDAKFWAFDEYTIGIIEYSINSSGVVSSTTIPLSGFYTMPSGGIPYTDLASAVQASLDKADTAYQKPDGGITKADLTSAIRNSLGKADSAYQLPLTGMLETDLATESVVISPGESAGQYVSSKTYQQIAQAASDGYAIKPEFWPDNNTTIRGAVLDIRSTASVFAFLDTSTTAKIYVFTVNAQGVTAQTITFDGGSGPAIPTPTQSDNGKYLGVVNGEYALRTAPSGGGLTLYTVTAVYRSGYWYIQHDGSDIAAEDIFTALFGGALVQFTDDAGAEGEMIEVYYDGPGTGHIVYKTSNMDNNVPGWRLFDITDEIVQSAPRAEVTMTPVELLPVSDSRTASQVGSGFTVDGNTVYAVSGTISGFTLITSIKPTMLPGQCIEIRLTTGSSAITTPTWPSWCKHMNGWDGKFSANTYYDIVIDDAGNVYAGSREVSA